MDEGRKDPHAEARHWVVRLASGDMPRQELDRLRAWRDADTDHEAAFRRERQDWRDLAVIGSAFGTAPARLSVRRRVMPKLVGMAAAIAAGIVAAPPLLQWLRTDHASPHGVITKVALTDGTLAVLDSESAIDIDYDEHRRLVRLLKGRAWFQVRHGDARPFRVAAADGVIEDVGTAFDVDATGAGIRVGVTEGEVRVANGGHAPLSMHTGERAAFGGRRSVVLIPGDAVAMSGWRDGELLMRAMPVDAAIAAIARYRAGPVFVWGDLSREAPVSGSFRTDKPNDALATLIVMRRLRQMRLPGGIVILRR